MGALEAIGPYAMPAATAALSLAAGMDPLSAAVASVAMYAIENTQRAEAGPALYATCVKGCALLFPPAIPICIAGCLPTLAIPGP